MEEIVLCQCYWSSQLVRPLRRLFCAGVTGPVSWSVHGGDCSVPVLLVQSVGPVRPWWRLFCASVTGPVSWSGPFMEEIVLCQCYWSSQLVRSVHGGDCSVSVLLTSPISWSVHGGDCSVPVLLTSPISWSVHGGDCSVSVLLTSPISWSVHGGDCSVSVLLTSPISWSVHGGDCSVSVLLVQSVGPSMEEIVLCQCYWSSQLVRPWRRLFCAGVTGPVSWSVHGGDCSVLVLLVQSVGPSMEEIILCKCYWSSQLVRPWRRLFCVSVTGPVSWSVHGGDCSVPVLLVQSVGPSMEEIILCKCYWSNQLVRPWRRLFCVSVTGPVSWSVHGGDCSVPVLLVQSVGPSMEEIVLCYCYRSSQLVRPWRRLFCASVTGPVSWSVHGGDCSVQVLLVQSVGLSMVEIVLCQCYWSSQLVCPWRRLFCASVTGPVSWSVHGGDCSVQVLLVQSVGLSMVEIVQCQCYWSSQLVRPWWRLFCAGVTGPVSWSVHGGDCSVQVLLVQSVGLSMEEIVLCQCYWSNQLVRPWRRLFCASVTGPVSWSVHSGDCSVQMLLVQSVGPSMVEIVLCQCYWSVHGGDCSV